MWPDSTGIGFIGGYAYNHENQAAILQRSIPTYCRWRAEVDDMGVWKVPDELDPREWYDIHNQGNQGSCQGHSLADSVDYCHYLETGIEVNTSRGFAYLASQQADGLLGSDQGSTLNGGSKAAIFGIPLETRFPYTESYRALLTKYRNESAEILLDETNLWHLKGEVPLATEEDCFRFLSTRSGIIQIGIMWGLPDAWEITSYSSGGGGHAVTIAGYLKVSTAGWNGRGYLLKNSWGEVWGKSGWCLLKPSVLTQMLKARYTVFIGRSQPETPRPKPEFDV